MDPTARFSDRVALYQRFRPGYPPELIDVLCAQCGVAAGVVVADIGAGTGILTRLLLECGAVVHAVEPNQEMRCAAQQLLAGYPLVTTHGGRAEDSGLPDRSVDVVTAAQAFHWFDQARAKREFHRILKPGGAIAILWNERLTEVTPLSRDYEELLRRFATDYQQVDHRTVDGRQLSAFFAPAAYSTSRFRHRQHLDYEGLAGRLLSSSYAPAPGQARHAAMMQELERIFHRHAVDGGVDIVYEAIIHHARIPS